MASKQELDDEINITVETQYLDNDNATAMFSFGKDERETTPVSVNTLSKPVLIQYYSEAVQNWE